MTFYQADWLGCQGESGAFFACLLLLLLWLTLLTIDDSQNMSLTTKCWTGKVEIMFVKIFDQILDSSIASNYELRHFFEDMLKLADPTGAVDITPEAIARRINLPLEKVLPFLAELGQPDKKSRSPGNEGRRILPLDSHRDWGWIIVNYEHYRAIRNQVERRIYNRDAQRRHRNKKNKKPKLPVVNSFYGPTTEAQAEG